MHANWVIDMAIEASAIAQLVALLDALPPATNPRVSLLKHFPDWTISCCDAEDMRDEVPHCQAGRYTVFLLDSREHCWRMTDALDMATGVVLAEKTGAEHG